jgi:hypothetical protein
LRPRGRGCVSNPESTGVWRGARRVALRAGQAPPGRVLIEG